MKKIGLLFCACLLSLAAFAVIASPEPIEVTQADGSVVTVKLVGDEFHSYYTLLDGTPVRRTADNRFVPDASVVEMSASERQIRKAAQQTQISGSYPLTGSPKSLVILVNFTDLKFQFKLEDYQKMLNESGYSENNGVGSARDYFIACSDSVFSPIFDCYGPVTVSKDYAYYGKNVGSSSSAHASQMIVEACNLVADMGVDLTQYDTDNDGRLDNVFVYYAGHNEAEGGPANSIWPHRSVVQTGDRVQGKLIYDYACTSEMRGSSGKSMCGIGTFCHEFGHVLGLPDYYNTENSYAYTVGTWDIMCSGSYNGNGKTPPSYSAGERFQLGWLKPVQLKEAGAYTLQPLETTNTAYLLAKTDHNLRWADANPNEYWLLENRQNLGWDRHSSSLPGTGMVIFHITYNSNSWGSNTPNNGNPLLYDIEEAAGVKGYSAPSDPFPGSFNVKQFTPVLHSGEIVDQPLYNIEQTGNDIQFTFKSSDFMVLPTSLPVIQSTYNPDTQKSKTPGSKLKVVGEDLDPDTDVSIKIDGKGFQISFDSTSWSSNTLYVRPNAGTAMEQVLFVRYRPGKVVCTNERGTITVKQGSKIGSYIVYGTCPRPVLIEAPQISTFEQVTPTTFKVHWDPQTDAENYYVTLYHHEPGEETTMESFEGFDDPVVVQEADWFTNFYRTTSKAKEEGSESIWFKENNEMLLSPIYPLPVTNLSFWLSAPATSDTEVGFINLVAYGETGIDTLDQIKISKSTKKYTYTRALDINKGYKRFEMVYTSLGGEGVCFDAFRTTFNEKIVYTYKGREKTIAAQNEYGENITEFYAYDLIPNTAYYVRLQCSEAKGCTEHLSDLSMATVVFTKEGEDAESNHLTLGYDSISYNPATHVVYIPRSLTKGYLNIYTPSGELVKRIPISPTVNTVELHEGEFTHGALYLLKYMPAEDGKEKMGRKTPWIKIIFQ